MMRGYWRVVPVLLAAGALHPGRAAAQLGFNGVITFQSDRSGGKSDTFVQTTKGNKLRLDGFGSSQGTMIIDNDAKTMIIVEPDKKQYMLMTQEDAKQMQAMMGPMMEQMKHQQHRTDPSKYKFEKTGKSEVVAGVPCEMWHGVYAGENGEKDEGDACVAEGVGFALADLTFNNPMLQQTGAAHDQMEQFRQLVGGNKGILKATSTKDGKPSTQLEATKVERKVVGDDVFAPPAGYKEIRMSDMMAKAHEGMQMKQPAKPQ